MSKEINDGRIFLLKDDEGNDHLVKRVLGVTASTVPAAPNNIPETGPFGFIFWDSFSKPQSSEFATFVDIMSGERFRASENELCLYASTE